MSACALRKTYADTMHWPSTFDTPSVPMRLTVGMNVWVKYGCHIHFVVGKIVKPLFLVVLQTGMTFFCVFLQ